MPSTITRKKPSQLEAVQYEGTVASAAEVMNWTGKYTNAMAYFQGVLCIIIQGAVVQVRPNDWVVKDEGNEIDIYPDSHFRRAFNLEPESE